MIVFLYVLVAIISLLVIGIILIQPSKSGGMGAAFGGIGESVFGAQVGSHLTKATVIMTGIFFLLALVLASLIGHGYRDDNSASAVTRQLEEAAAVELPKGEKAPEAVVEAKSAAGTPVENKQ
ncbi:MAG: preprotein translocase subunit SecG [Lentisphaeria bacterium]|nr:preprotein translocase subunit SecG [Lentisphaeria bacterium]